MINTYFKLIALFIFFFLLTVIYGQITLHYYCKYRDYRNDFMKAYIYDQNFDL